MSTSPQGGSNREMAQPNPFDKYELRQRLGQSDRVEVWKAFDSQQQHFVAIKILHPNIKADRDFPVRFLEEAKRASSLHHPNIVRIRDFGFAHSSEVTGTTAYIIMDYVEGQTLADYIHSTSHQGKFPSVPEIVRLLIPISLAIDYAHQHGMIHGDLEPSNILLDQSNTFVNPMGQPILSDFGIAHMLRAPSRSPSRSSAAASSYTAPEQAQGNPGNERSDLYSLGVILFELFTGVLPFQENDPVDTIKKRVHATPDSPNPNMLPALSAVILRNLAKDPAERFPSAVALVVALAKAVNMPVPEHLKQVTSSLDATNAPTYLSPLPASRPPGMTPSSPSWPGMASSSPLPTVNMPSTSSTEYSQEIPKQSGAQGPAGASFHTSPITFTGQFPVPQAVPAVYSATPPPAQALAQTPPVSPSYSYSTPQPKRRRGLYIALIASLIVLLVLAGSGLGAYFVFFHHAPATPAQPTVGHAFFVSSGLLSLNSAQGITDELQLNLQGIPNPQPGKSYYAWLLNDKNAPDSAPLLLGKLTVNQGTVNFPYPGNAQHTNLLATYSRLLITEEDATVTPTNPSLDPSAFRYYAEFPETPNPVTGFSVLNHLRHLLAEDPKIKLVGLTGGLDIWLFRNTEKILEWSGSAKDAQQQQTLAGATFIHRQVVRILDYLDGATYVSVQKDVPPGTPLLVDPTIARVALLEFDVQNQVPPGYLYHIGKHLREIVESPHVTPAQVALATQINQAINNVKFWLDQVHKDALQLVNMTDAQLLQDTARPILDDMATSANNAFAGQIDPTTNQVVPGIVQVHYNIQRLATFDITPCTSNGTSSTCVL